MDKHTPGPWRAVQRSYGYPEYSGGPVRLLWDVDSPSGEPVAIGTIIAENEGNAHLIAAAPELLEALEALTLDGDVEIPFSHAHRILHVVAKARNATHDEHSTTEERGRDGT